MTDETSRIQLYLRPVFGLALFLSFGLSPGLVWGVTEEEAGVGTCVSSSTTLCLQGDRFEVDIAWNAGKEMGAGQVLTTFGSDTGIFTFTDPGTAEVLLKVLDGCAFNNQYWVFIANVSSLGQIVTVTDTVLGNETFYTNPEGSFGDPITDTAALPCDPSLEDRPVRSPQSRSLGSNVLSLAGGRFEIEVNYEDFEGNTGIGMPEPLTDSSGAFSLFLPENLQILFKVQPIPTSDSYGVFFSSLTNVELEVTVTDTCNGQVRTYLQPLGTSSTVGDTAAFPLGCPTIFDDGFESSDASAWSSAVGLP